MYIGLGRNRKGLEPTWRTWSELHRRVKERDPNLLIKLIFWGYPDAPPLQRVLSEREKKTEKDSPLQSLSSCFNLVFSCELLRIPRRIHRLLVPSCTFFPLRVGYMNFVFGVSWRLGHCFSLNCICFDSGSVLCMWISLFSSQSIAVLTSSLKHYHVHDKKDNRFPEAENDSCLKKTHRNHYLAKTSTVTSRETFEQTP